MKPEEKLPDWSAEWVRDGVVTAAQRDAILARHPVPEGGHHRFLAILATIGGSLLLVGVSLIIKANWEEIGDWFKIGGLVTLLTGTYALGWRFKISPGHYPKIGDACLMVAAGCFMLGIALVSQIFHIDSRPANGVLLWWTGIVALPWLTRAKGMQFVSVVAGLTWFGFELASRDSWIALYGDDASNEGYLFAAAGTPVGLAVLLFGLGLRNGKHEFFCRRAREGRPAAGVLDPVRAGFQLVDRKLVARRHGSRGPGSGTRAFRTGAGCHRLCVAAEFSRIQTPRLVVAACTGTRVRPSPRT